MKAQVTYIILIIFAMSIRLALAASLEKFDSCSPSQFHFKLFPVQQTVQTVPTNSHCYNILQFVCERQNTNINTQNISVRCVDFSNQYRKYVRQKDKQRNASREVCLFLDFIEQCYFCALHTIHKNSKVRLFG